MARPRSEDKRNAILAAAARVVSSEGVSAATARISKDAGVAEGTLFTYFENKDVLFNELYLYLKAGVRESMMKGFTTKGSAEHRVRQAWNGYLDWGVAYPDGHRALRQLGFCDRIDAQHRAAGAEGFSALSQLLLEKLSGSSVPAMDALAFIGSVFNTMADNALDFIARDGAKADYYREAGFRAFWGAVKGGGR
ncbi:TetR/AcrR family transcriptional regulator [Bordetella sp. LUAb4]|uniref:TetR/AcrR family transcriptional regulator n=1 Tax=Bordetella sp. LUAb4 TaxID=2843195 RepID=UPI001E2CBE90|nr:TetR/AcrR family transcriptional regulator [Bordetella sp. LUAb4]